MYCRTIHLSSLDSLLREGEYWVFSLYKACYLVLCAFPPTHLQGGTQRLSFSFSTNCGLLLCLNQVSLQMLLRCKLALNCDFWSCLMTRMWVPAHELKTDRFSCKCHYIFMEPFLNHSCQAMSNKIISFLKWQIKCSDGLLSFSRFVELYLSRSLYFLIGIFLGLGFW